MANALVALLECNWYTSVDFLSPFSLENEREGALQGVFKKRNKMRKI